MKHKNMTVKPLFTTFFAANDCTINEDGSIIHVTLSEEMDKALMNRPFYWHYVEATGQKGIPQTISFSFDKQITDKKTPFVHFGCPWFQKIKQYLSDNCAFIHAFESVQTNTNTMLQPWLLANILITYSGKSQREELHSFGLNLVNGIIHLNMMEKLKERPITKTIPNFCYTISPVITLQSGFKRIEQFIYQLLMEEEHQWAIEANETLQEEKAMLYHFYTEKEHKNDLEKEVAALKKRLQPTITFSVLNGGLLYLTENFITSETKKSST